jgi:hypothetical protein
MGSGRKRGVSRARSTPKACGVEQTDGRKRRASGARSEAKPSGASDWCYKPPIAASFTIGVLVQPRPWTR